MSELLKRMVELIQNHDHEGFHHMMEFLQSSELESSHDISVKNLLSMKTKRKYTLLHESIFHRNYTAFESLLLSGADPNSKCHGTPPIHLCLITAQLPNGREFSIKAFSSLLETGDIDLEAKDDHGGTILHIISEYNDIEAYDCLVQFTDGSAPTADSIMTADRLGLTCLHRAILNDSVEILRKLCTPYLSMDSESEDTIHLDAATNTGATIAHMAIAQGAVNCWSFIRSLPVFRNLMACRDLFDRTPTALSEWFGYDGEAIRNGGDLIMIGKKSSSSLTGIISDVKFMDHNTCPPSDLTTQGAPPENPYRLKVLIDPSIGALNSADIKKNLFFVDHCSEAPIADVMRVHEWSYLRKIMAKCETLSDNPEGEGGIGFLDGDTAISKKSFSVALKACGAVCHGVDLVMQGAIKNAFCPIRPPGHHVGPRGVVRGKLGGPDSHGFCLLNNISVGAAYALSRYRDHIKKVVILDFDVHHGNGTEETVRWLQPGLEEIEVANDFFFSNLQAPRYKPWFDFDDHQNVFFVSVHGYGPREAGLEYLMPRAAFYPGSGETHYPNFPFKNGKSTHKTKEETKSTGETGAVVYGGVTEHSEESEEVSAAEAVNDEQDSDDNDDDYNEESESGDDDGETPQAPSTMESEGVQSLRKIYSMDAKEPLILDVGMPLPDQSVAVSSAAYRHQWRNHFRREIFPRIDAFAPDMIFISAGFDGHKKDTINSGYLSLVEEDFEWITTHLVRLANKHSQGRVISALEGGYQLGAEYCSAFAKSVKTHVAALNAGRFAMPPFHEADMVVEEQYERRVLDEMEARRAEKEALINASNLLTQDLAPLNGHEEEQLLGAESSRKRRRSQVDYIALDRELRQTDPTQINMES